MAFALRSLLLFCGISALLTGVWSVANVSIPGCPTGWDRLNDRCFIYRTTSLSFAAAEEACNNAGGNLATIRNAVEDALAFQLIRNANSGLIVDSWIGHHDGIEEGDFILVDGVDSKFENFREPNQPDNFLNEDCVEIDDEGDWNDDSCTDTQPFLCAINLW
ncbi:galactose-specific lectin nattectin-like [Phyllopteryx taeniolatus]|uniref:galactose-specific lectin nattectin-like n=1 Tax=Phyllopteryx taeniolatus TaxID=161469 RepID=UPI002AD58733|nr:galactose-specific lectin nattectin-like [Phyllopteryx taeniolatus]